jgi:hypothetical protein
LKGKRLVILALTLATVVVMLVTGCSTTPTASPTPTATKPAATTTPTTTPTPITQVVEKDKSYNILSPRGIALPVTVSALAPRPATIDGLTLYIVQGEADPIIMPALAQIAPQKYPKTTWVYFNPVSGFGAAAPETEVLATAKGVVRGISW